MYMGTRAPGVPGKAHLSGPDPTGYVNRLKAMVACAGDDPEHNIEVRIGQLVSIAGARMAKRAGNMIEMRDLISWIGADAVRYSLARYPADSPLSLDGEELRKRTNDNPVFYVQYAHARTCNVTRLAGDDGHHVNRLVRDQFGQCLFVRQVAGVRVRHGFVIHQAVDRRRGQRGAAS